MCNKDINSINMIIDMMKDKWSVREDRHHIAIFFDNSRSYTKKIVCGENDNINKWSKIVSVHAEMSALKKLKGKYNKRDKYNLLVIRLTKKGKLGESRPCYHCLEALEKSGININDVYYSTQEENIEKEKFYNMKKSSKTKISNGYVHSMKINRKI